MKVAYAEVLDLGWVYYGLLLIDFVGVLVGGCLC